MRVVINFGPNGELQVVTDDACEVYTVDDRAPNGRVYRISDAHMVGRSAVDAVLRDDPVGHSGDERHAAISSRVLAAIDGAPHLKLVE